MRDVNRAFEAAVRRDPANWFWVHSRWKPDSAKVESPESKVENAGHRRMNSPSAICHLPSAPRILVRGTNWLGDAVMTTPALLRLREKFPDAHIALLTPEKLRDLWAQSSGGQRNDFICTGRKCVFRRQKIARRKF